MLVLSGCRLYASGLLTLCLCVCAWRKQILRQFKDTKYVGDSSEGITNAHRSDDDDDHHMMDDSHLDDE